MQCLDSFSLDGSFECRFETMLPLFISHQCVSIHVVYSLLGKGKRVIMPTTPHFDELSGCLPLSEDQSGKGFLIK